MDRAESERAWARSEPGVRGGPIALAARALLVAVVVCSLVWIPLARTAVGTISAADAALFLLWAVTALDLLVRGIADLDVETPSIVILALAIAALAAGGAAVSTSHGRGLLEFMLFVKRFALAAVIPLAAARFRSPGMAPWMRLVTVAAIAALVAFTLNPELRDVLPKPDDWEEDATQRALGLGTNPNDLAYAAVAVTLLHAAFLPRRSSLLDRLLLVAVLGGAATCVVASGSRSGLLGAAAAILSLIVASHVGGRAKLALSAGSVAVVVLGLVASPVFEERLARLHASGLAEQNLSARLDAQWLAVSTSYRHPFGVGFRNIEYAVRREHARRITTTDSVFLDTLVGAGYPGLFALLLLFRAGWRNIARTTPGARCGSVLRAGVLAFVVFGTATVVPVSVFLSPLFFTVLAGGSYARDENE